MAYLVNCCLYTWGLQWTFSNWNVKDKALIYTELLNSDPQMEEKKEPTYSDDDDYDVVATFLRAANGSELDLQD